MTVSKVIKAIIGLSSLFFSTQAFAVEEEPYVPSPPGLSVSVPSPASGNTFVSTTPVWDMCNELSGFCGTINVTVKKFGYTSSLWSAGSTHYTSSQGVTMPAMPTQGWANGTYIAYASATGWHGLTSQLASTTFTVSNSSQASVAVSASAIYGGYLSLNGSAYFGPDAYWWGKYGTVYVQIKNVYNGSMFWAAFSSYSQSFPLSSIAPIYIGHYPPGAYKVYVSAAMPYYANYVTASASFNIAGASTPTPDPVILPTTPQSQNELASNDTNTDLNIVDECKKEAAKKASQGETNPVNLATGDKFLTEHDVRVGQISISRSYHSRSTHAGDMGYGWGWTYGWSLQSGQTSPEVTHIRRGDGKLMLFNASGNRLLEMTDETVTPSGGGWIYHAHDRSTVTFDASGHAISFAKENGQAITVTYDGSGNPTSITDHFGRTVLVTTDGQGRITSFSDPIGRTWAYGYDANNNLTMYSNPNSGTRQYGYTDADVHNLTSITNEAGILYAQYAYDVNDRAILSEHLYGNMHTIQYLADKTVVTDAAGVSRNHILATNTNIPRIASVDATTSGCGAINFDFTAEGNLSTAYDGNGIATQYVRNSSGDITTRLDAPGTTESRTWYYGYDALGRRTSVTLPDGGALVTTYDAAGRITSKVDQANKVESMQWNADSTLASVTDRNGNITQFSYLNGDPVSVTYPDGSVGTYAYDGAGRMTGMTDALGRTTSITLDGRDQATAISYPDGSQESFTYDPMGQLASHTDRAGLITSIQRNNEGFVTQVNYPDGSLLKNRIGLIGDIETRQVLGSNNMTALYDNFTYNEIHLPLTVTHADGSVSSIAYNANNKPVTLTDEAGSVTTLAYDNLGRTSSVTDPLNGQSLIQYDPVGRKSGFTDANGVPTSFAYNLTGTIASETSPDIGTVQYGYDNNGNTLFMTDARGITANFGYDNRNRLAAIAYPADTSRNVALTYDVANRVTGMLDVTGNTGFGYNAMDAVTSVRWTPAGSGSSITTGYGYDAAGRMASITYPSGRVVNYAYGTNGHVSSVSLGVTSLISNVGYHATGIMKSFARGNGELEFRNFDMRSRITSIDNRNLVWSPVSNITAITDVAVPTSNQALTYDLNSRLTDAAGSYGAINYAYDANANRTSKNAVSVPYVFGTNMVSSVVRDVAGNRASDASFQYGYAVNNRLAEVTDLVGTPIASYRHNALGQRQIKVVNGQTTYFVFDLNGRLLAEIDAATSDETDHVYNAGERIASIMPDGLILWHHNDHLGTPMSLVDAAGATVWEASYTPFGLATVNDDPDGNGVAVTNNLRFQGQYFDAETGLHYNYHRTYDPALGRYTQADPIGLNGGTNRFGYVGGNPVKYVDPLGLSGIALFARPVPIARIPTPRVGETKAQYERRIHDWSKQQRKGWREEVRKNPLERISKNDPFGYSVRLIDKFKKFLENLQDLDFFGMPPEIYVSPNGEYCDA